MATSACACVPVAGLALSVDLLVQIGVERASCGWGRETKRKSRKRDKQAPPARYGCTWNTDRVAEGMFCNVDVGEIIASGLHDHGIPVLDQLLHRILQWCVCVWCTSQTRKQLWCSAAALRCRGDVQQSRSSQAFCATLALDDGVRGAGNQFTSVAVHERPHHASCALRMSLFAKNCKASPA